MKLLPLKLSEVDASTIFVEQGQEALSPQQLEKYANEAATLHFNAWGKYEKDRTLEQWKTNWLDDENKLAVLIVVDDNDKILGTASLKETNMDNQFPELTPWFSGFYVSPEGSEQGVGLLLMFTIEQIAKAMGYETLYLFEHEILTTRDYYRAFGWYEYEDENADPNQPVQYTYRDKPILLLQGNVDELIKVMSNYFGS